MNIEILIEIMSEVFQNQDYIKKFYSQPKSLNYDPLFLLKSYNKETSISGNIPYHEEVCWIGDTWEQTRKATSNIFVKKHLLQFKLDDSSEEIKTFQSEALKERNLTKDSEVIRLNSIEYKEQITSLKIQLAKYSDQVQSNLAMDWDNHALKEKGFNTLRSYLLEQYDSKLPPLDDNRLANTIGISVVLFYKKDGNYVPYLPRRSKPGSNEKRQLAVFEGGYHCTASGALEWNNTESSFGGIFTDDMYRELREEVGINQSEIKVMIPVALCREFLRGGKPQIFFVGITTLSAEEIKDRRSFAILKQEKDDIKVEIQDDQLYFLNSEKLSEQINANSITIEAYANCYYAKKFIQQYEKKINSDGYDYCEKYHSKPNESSLENYNTLINSDPNNPVAYYNRAIFYRDQKNYEFALSDFDKAIKFYDSLKDKKQCCLMASNIAVTVKKYDKAKEYVELAFESASSTEQQHKDSYLANISIAEELDRKNIELEDMMAMFAHKFRSPLDAIIYNTTHENQVKLYTEAAQTMRGLLDIFSIISTDAALLKRKLIEDQQGSGRLLSVLSKTLDMILLHLLSNSGREKIRQHYIAYAKAHGQCDATVSRKTWREECYELEQALQTEWEHSFAQLLNRSAPLPERLEWLAQHFFALELIGFDRDDIAFEEYGLTESLLTIILNEILVNAFKYYASDTNQPVSLEWAQRDGQQTLICRNPSFGLERTMHKGSQKGHSFLATLARNIGSHFTKPIPQDHFIVEFSIPNALLIAKQAGEA